jgi:hypothetical protein
MDMFSVAGGQYESGWPEPSLLNIVQGVSQAFTKKFSMMTLIAFPVF